MLRSVEIYEESGIVRYLAHRGESRNAEGSIHEALGFPADGNVTTSQFLETFLRHFRLRGAREEFLALLVQEWVLLNDRPSDLKLRRALIVDSNGKEQTVSRFVKNVRTSRVTNDRAVFNRIYMVAAMILRGEVSFYPNGRSAPAFQTAQIPGNGMPTTSQPQRIWACL